MEIIYSDEAQRDIDYWKKSGNKVVQRKIQQLLNAIEQSPHEELANPSLSGINFQGCGREELT